MSLVVAVAGETMPRPGIGSFCSILFFPNQNTPDVGPSVMLSPTSPSSLPRPLLSRTPSARGRGGQWPVAAAGVAGRWASSRLAAAAAAAAAAACPSQAAMCNCASPCGRRSRGSWGLLRRTGDDARSPWPWRMQMRGTRCLAGEGEACSLAALEPVLEEIRPSSDFCKASPFQNLSDQMRFSSLAQHVPVHKETEHHLPDQKMFCLPQCQEKCLDLSVQKAFQKKFVVGKFRCHKVVGVWQVNKVSKGELVPSKELTLTKPLFIDFKDFFQFSFLCVDIIIVVILHRKGQVAKQCPARRIKRMLLMTEPLFNGSPLQNILSQQERIPTLHASTLDTSGRIMDFSWYNFTTGAPAPVLSPAMTARAQW
uniref:Uncharacterized protein n=1 Tax=Oryza nivara TaxID=4536 RepID=A0A0E0IFI8_ORYNI